MLLYASFFKEKKLYTKLVPETVYTLSIPIKIFLRLFLYHHHLQKIFRTGTSI